ncbi:MAG: lipopolysaccharide heptosyltransferase II [bacterium]
MKKILIINHNHIGDVLLTTPVIKKIRKYYKDFFVICIVGENAKDVLLNNPNIDEIIIRKKGTKDFFKLLFIIIKHKFDVSFIFQDTIGNAILTWLSNIPKRIGYKKEGAQIFLTKSIKRNFLKHTIISYFELLGIQDMENNLKMEIFLNETDKENVEKIFIKENIKKEDLIIAICPFSARKNKQWNSYNLAQVIDYVMQKYNAKVIIIGSEKEKSQVHEILSLTKEKENVINLVGRTTVRELAYIFNKCKIVITSDSGAMHTAATAEKPTIISLFGSTNPVEVAPIENKHITFYKKIKCNPCKINKCKHKTNKCMQEITVNEIKEAISNILT